MKIELCNETRFYVTKTFENQKRNKNLNFARESSYKFNSSSLKLVSHQANFYQNEAQQFFLLHFNRNHFFDLCDLLRSCGCNFGGEIFKTF